MTLVIQTNISGTIFFWLLRGRKNEIADYNKNVSWHGSDAALAFLDEILRRRGERLQDIRHIIVVRGPGGFTAVRTGLLLANTMSSELRIPVTGVVAKHQLTPKIILQLHGRRGLIKSVRPYYGKAPNITKPKSRRRR